MFDIFLPVALSFIITFVTVPVVITIADQKKLYDAPNSRKVHTAAIASLGGLAIFAGFTLAVLVSATFAKAHEFQYFIAASIVIFFLGLKDDILILAPSKKFIGQLLAAFLIIYKGGIQIKSMYGFLGIHELPEAVSLLLTYFTIVLIINSFNLIDGIDGLAGSLGLMATTVLGLYFWKVGIMPYAILSFSMAGSLGAFLIFNFQPAKIFMGDSGSLLIGLICAILVIKFINISVGNVRFPVIAAPAIGFSIVLIPLLDTLRVFSIRIMNRRSPFSADKNHVHHILLNKKLSHQQITFLLVSINLLFIAIAYAGKAMGCTWLIGLLFTLFFAGIGVLYYKQPKPEEEAPEATGKRYAKLITSKWVPTPEDTTVLEEN